MLCSADGDAMLSGSNRIYIRCITVEHVEVQSCRAPYQKNYRIQKSGEAIFCEHGAVVLRFLSFNSRLPQFNFPPEAFRPKT